MSRYAGIIKNDVVNGNGICVSFFLQGCPLRCKGCHNMQTWDFSGGNELPDNYLNQIKEAIEANGIYRNFSLLGGEPLCEENVELSLEIVRFLRKTYEDKIQINIWSGYTYEELISKHDLKINAILAIADVLIDGPYEEFNRDITLKMRGSSNQRLIDLKKTALSNNVIIKEYK